MECRVIGNEQQFKRVSNQIDRPNVAAVILTFSARYNIYISRLCYDVSAHLSVQKLV